MIELGTTRTGVAKGVAVPQRRRALVNERIRWVEFGEGVYDGSLSAQIDGKEVSDQLDYDDRLDVYYHME